MTASKCKALERERRRSGEFKLAGIGAIVSFLSHILFEWIKLSGKEDREGKNGCLYDKSH